MLRGNYGADRLSVRYIPSEIWRMVRKIACKKLEKCWCDFCKQDGITACLCATGSEHKKFCVFACVCLAPSSLAYVSLWNFSLSVLFFSMFLTKRSAQIKQGRRCTCYQKNTVCFPASAEMRRLTALCKVLISRHQPVSLVYYKDWNKGVISVQSHDC